MLWEKGRRHACRHDGCIVIEKILLQLLHMVRGSSALATAANREMSDRKRDARSASKVT